MTIVTRHVNYAHGDVALTGVVAEDEAITDRRAGLLLVHGGAGLDDHAIGQARRYAAPAT